MHYIDKRDHYRLDDSIQVTYKAVSRNDADTSLPEVHFDTGKAFLLLRDIYRLDLEAADLLRSIAGDNRQLASLLHNVNRRVELLARAVLADELGAEHGDNWQARISEGGISFIASELLTPGTHLALKLLFHPTLLGLVTFGEVRHCRLIADREDYVVGVSFAAMDPGSRELIARHILHRQAEQRRQQIRNDAGI